MAPIIVTLARVLTTLKLEEECLLFQRAHREKWKTTERCEETSGRNKNLRLIETLFHDPYEVILLKVSK